VAAAFAFDLADEVLGAFRFSGLAVGGGDGSPVFNYVFSSPERRVNNKVELTAPAIHEWGHHVGLGHPHDGYDSQTDKEYSAEQPEFAFAWSGGETHTLMNYLNLSVDFGQFDRDNLWRWETAGYLNQANTLLAAVLADSQRDVVASQLLRADQLAASALQDLRDWNYLRAVQRARSASLMLELAADRIGVSSSPALRAALRAVPGRPIPHDYCRVGTLLPN
jgi:hypothetical protein